MGWHLYDEVVNTGLEVAFWLVVAGAFVLGLFYAVDRPRVRRGR